MIGCQSQKSEPCRRLERQPGPKPVAFERELAERELLVVLEELIAARKWVLSQDIQLLGLVSSCCSPES